MLEFEHTPTVISDYVKRQLKAQYAVSKAIREGILVRPDTCELCGSVPLLAAHAPIVAHHWKGYEEEAKTDIWWICAGCNQSLRGPQYHNGTVTKEEARAIIEAHRKAKQDKANQLRIGKIKLKDYEVAFRIRLEERRCRFKIVVTEAQNQQAAIDFAREYAITEMGAKEVRFQWAERYYQP